MCRNLRNPSGKHKRERDRDGLMSQRAGQKIRLLLTFEPSDARFWPIFGVNRDRLPTCLF